MRLVQEGGSSSSSGPAAMSDDVEESAPVGKLVAPPAPTADDKEEHTQLIVQRMALWTLCHHQPRHRVSRRVNVASTWWQ